MDVSEPKLHSFIIKLWLDKAPDEEGRIEWHGYVTHVPGNERRYLKDLDEIIDFIISYLEEEGARVRLREKIYRRLKGLRLR